MASIPSYILFFLLLVGPLVLIHEFGHFAVAKLCGIKVVRFSFGFGPRLIGFRSGDTDYRLSLLPLGGYVKMAGDNPAEEIAPEDRPHSFLSAPAWKRALIAFAGPAMNLTLPVVVFFCLAVFTTHEGLVPMVGVVMPDSPAARAGIQPSDRIVSIDGKKVQAFDDLRDLIAEASGPLRVGVARGDSHLDLTMTPDILEETDDLETTHRRVIGIRPLPPPATIGILDPASPAALAGLKTFDRVLEVGSVPVDDQIQLQQALERAQVEWRQKGLPAPQPVEVKVARGVSLGYRGLGPGIPRIMSVTLPGEVTPSNPPWGIDGADLFVRWVIPGSPADKAGIRAGDRLLALDAKPLVNWWGYEETLRKKQQESFVLTVQSPGGAARQLTLSQQLLDLGESPVTGVEVKALGAGVLHDGESLLPTDETGPREWVLPTLKTEPETFTIGDAWGKSLRATGDVIRKEVLGIVRIFQGRVSVKKLGGPLMIADVARQAAANGLAAFLFMMTLVSVNLGLVNLVPLPVLDGGHIATAAVEAVQRRPLSRRAYGFTNAFGFVLLLALMAFVLINDIVQKRGPGLFPVSCVGRGSLPGLLVAIAVAAVACRKPAPVDPAEAAYHAAVARFAEVSRVTQDLTYRDPRFDAVLDALDAIPAQSEPKPHAMALADRIRGARALANSQERTSQFLQAQAEAPPAFEAQLRLPPAPAPSPTASAVAQPRPAINPGSGESLGGVPAPRDGFKKLPAWYAGYFGAAEKSQDAGGTQADSAAVSAPDSPPARKRAPAAAPEPIGPPPVFGVPGPAGSALQGRP